MVHKRTNVGFRNTKVLLGVSEEVVCFFVIAAFSQNVSRQVGYHITVFQA